MNNSTNNFKIRRTAIEAVGKAVETALETIPKNVGVNVDETFSRLTMKLKRNIPRRVVKAVLDANELTLCGKIVSLANGNFALDATQKFDPTLTVVSSASSSASDDNSQDTQQTKSRTKKIVVTPPATTMKHQPGSSVREKSERKRIQKIVFDPSDVEPVRKKQKNDKDRVVDPNACKVCEEALLKADETCSCQICGEKTHRKCLSGVETLKGAQWRCDGCKACSLCRGKRASKNEAWVLCGVCGDSFHPKCVNFKRGNSQKWLCTTCKRLFQEDDADDHVDTKEKPKDKIILRRQSREVKKELNGETKEPESKIPDCSDWTPQQVYSYFLLFLPSQEAQVLLEQEVDGKVLLMLERIDVLTKFNLKLGPALKMYSFIKGLQLRSSDIRHCWH